jgi:hypothetical protein
MWSIRIYRRTSIEQRYSYFLGVDNDYRLASRIEVDEITCSEHISNGQEN